jgi:asparaginyl-tRNA synthetase
MHIAELLASESIDTTVTVQGWVVTSRDQKELTFLKINDGTCPAGLQVIVTAASSASSAHFTVGSALRIEGLVVKSPAAGQAIELQATHIDVLGACDPSYPLTKSKMSLEYLRDLPHLRARTSTFGSVFRIKSAISQATHAFWGREGYLHLDPNIMTVNECEGGAGVFQVTERDISFPAKLPLCKDVSGAYDWSRDHFGKPVYLTVSSQLQLEALACSLGSVYTMNKSFRSEHSSTNKHLSEFTHLEVETCFGDLDGLMSVAERYIKFLATHLLETAAEDLENLDRFVSKGLLARVQAIRDGPFHRVTYTEAVRVAQAAGKTIVFGDDLSSEVETALTTYYGGPVFVSHWPFAIKSFYMKQDMVTPTLCHNFDLLMPYKIGELIGGSMREDRLDLLMSAMEVKGIPPDSMKFYTDLRRYGSVPHGGFGLGFDRLTMLFTGMENIRDTVPFPVAYRSCDL